MLLATKAIKMQEPSHLCAERIINRKTSLGKSLLYLLAHRCSCQLCISGTSHCCNNPAIAPGSKPPGGISTPDMPSNLFSCKFLHCKICLSTTKRKEEGQSIRGLELGVGQPHHIWWEAPQHQPQFCAWTRSSGDIPK